VSVWGRGLATLFMFLYVTEEAGRKCVRDMPWPPAAECNMITNTQTKGVSVFMFSIEFMGFLWDYSFSIEFMGFLWVYSFPLSSWFSFGSTFVSFFWVYDSLLFIQIWV